MITINEDQITNPKLNKTETKSFGTISPLQNKLISK